MILTVYVYSCQKKQVKIIGIIGATGHFGKIISQILFSELSQVLFFIIGRHNITDIRLNTSFYYYDFLKDSDLPDFELLPDIIVDLSGPVLDYDGLAMRACARRNIPYMDIAIHNSHLKICEKTSITFPNSIILPHFGFFPGLSNLMISKGFYISGKKSGVLINEFPVLAGGGKNVAISLKNILNESTFQQNIINKKTHTFTMHSESKFFIDNNSAEQYYRWEYPEIACFVRSTPEITNLERFFSIKPWFINRIFKITVFCWKFKLFSIFRKLIPAIVFLVKSTFFKHRDPSLKMRFYENSNSRPLISLNVRFGVKFHGKIMANFLKVVLNKRLEPGIYTPEQLFSLNEILPAGSFSDYELIYANSSENSLL